MQLNSVHLYLVVTCAARCRSGCIATAYPLESVHFHVKTGKIRNFSSAYFLHVQNNLFGIRYAPV